MITLKNFQVNEKQTVATITLNLSKEFDVKQAKALAILLGNFNPLKSDMINPEECQKVLALKNEQCELENLLFEIVEQLKIVWHGFGILF
jgi:hypothetical protein